MTDIAKELREHHAALGFATTEETWLTTAANEIERLREALNDVIELTDDEIALRIARAALGGGEGMSDIVQRLRDLYEYDEDNQDTLSEAADEIERLREVLTIMIPHIEHMVRNAEDAKQVDTDFIRNRLYDARAALGERKE